MTVPPSYLKSNLDTQIKRRISKILMTPYQRTLVEMPVHLCPDDGDETEARWVTDMTPVSEALMEIVEEVYAIGFDDGKEHAMGEDWEYGLLDPNPHPDVEKPHRLQSGAHLVSSNLEHMRKQHGKGHPSIQLARRHPAGSWEIMKPENQDAGAAR